MPLLVPQLKIIVIVRTVLITINGNEYEVMLVDQVKSKI